MEVDGVGGRLEFLLFKIVNGRFYLNETFKDQRKGNSPCDLTE